MNSLNKSKKNSKSLTFVMKKTLTLQKNLVKSQT